MQNSASSFIYKNNIQTANSTVFCYENVYFYRNTSYLIYPTDINSCSNDNNINHRGKQNQYNGVDHKDEAKSADTFLLIGHGKVSIVAE